MSRYHTLVRHHSQFARKREKLDWLREQGFHAKPVYRPRLVTFVVGSMLSAMMWFAIWVGIWAVLP